MSGDVLDRLKANGGPLAKSAAGEIESLRERVTELSFALVLALAHLDGDVATEVANMLNRYGDGPGTPFDTTREVQHE